MTSPYAHCGESSDLRMYRSAILNFPRHVAEWLRSLFRSVRSGTTLHLRRHSTFARETTDEDPTDLWISPSGRVDRLVRAIGMVSEEWETARDRDRVPLHLVLRENPIEFRIQDGRLTWIEVYVRCFRILFATAQLYYAEIVRRTLCGARFSRFLTWFLYTAIPATSFPIPAQAFLISERFYCVTFATVSHRNSHSTAACTLRRKVISYREMSMQKYHISAQITA